MKELSPLNFVVVLRIKLFVFTSLLVILCVFSSPAQKTREIRSGDQTVFSAEEEKFEHAVPLNKSAKKTLASEQSIADVLNRDHA